MYTDVSVASKYLKPSEIYKHYILAIRHDFLHFKNMTSENITNSFHNTTCNTSDYGVQGPRIELHHRQCIYHDK